MSFDLVSYRADAERFIEESEREYLLHLAGHKRDLAIEPIYERHARLFDREALERLRELAGRAAGEERRRLRHLVHFALDGAIGQATKSVATEEARREAEMTIDGGAGEIPYRRLPVDVANQADRGRRAELERLRDEQLTERLEPLHREALAISHELCRELGWESYAAAYAELRSLDFARLHAQTQAFLGATGDGYAGVLDPVLARLDLPPLGEMSRSDMPRLMRAPELDGPFDAAQLVPSLAATLRSLGIELEAQANVTLDIEARATKTPRAFCSPVRVPDEIHLVVSPIGGRDDFAALLHEAGHTQHYAAVDPELPFEYRYLGDNAVTESFAFLFEHLTETPAWLVDRLGHEEPGVIEHGRAVRLLMMRRFAAKLSYELELHAPEPDLGAMPARYASLLGSATGIRWPQASWLADVDGGFYVVCYLRAWALEALWRRSLCERFGERWYAEPEAGAWLRRLWREGQSLSAEELAERELGAELEFGTLAAELAGESAASL